MPGAIQARRLALAAATVVLLSALMLALASVATEAAAPSTRARIHVTPCRQPDVRVEPALPAATPSIGTVRLQAAAGTPVYVVPDDVIVAMREHARSAAHAPAWSPGK